MRKFLKESLNITGENDSDQDWPEFRYAEILLNFAEAAQELNKPAEALVVINQIRNRAGIAELNSIDLERIRHERRIELALEGHRYWDLRRWRIAESALNGRYLKGLHPYWNIDDNTYVYKLVNADGYAKGFSASFQLFADWQYQN
jgi:starch-binding outer membrane protein, SusD/RagB family